MNKTVKANLLRNAVILSLIPGKTIKVRPEANLLCRLRISLIKYLRSKGQKAIEKNNGNETDDAIGELLSLSNDGWYEFKISWYQSEESANDTFSLQAKLVVRIYENVDDDESDVHYEFEIPKDDPTYAIHLKYAGYPESGLMVGNINQYLS